MSTSPTPQPRRSAEGAKKNVTPPTSTIVTRNGARKAKIQTRAMSAGAKPSASVLAAKKKAHQKKKQSFDSGLRDYYQIAMDCKNKVKGATGLVTEPRMAEHKCLWDDNYPECPERLISVIERCKELNLIEQCKIYESKMATKEELCTLHSPSVYELLESTHQNENLDCLEDVSSKFDSIYIHPSTHELALLAAGSTVDLVERIVSGEIQNGAALVRPPGHHAMRAEPCGYCFYNNVALAASAALRKGLSRILIVDWDVHHGQATQQMFYNDPRVVYFSIHRYEHGSFWPNLRQSDFHYIGSGPGKGYNFNVPLNKTGMKDGDYLAIWHQLLLPMALEYQPELVIVSAGYDAAVGCPEFSPELIIISAGYDAALGDEKGEMEVTPACYATLTHLLMCVTPSVYVVLEGGYCLDSLAEGAALTLRTLLGHPPPYIEDITEPSDSIRDTILNCIYAHKKYWRCYNYQPAYSTDTSVPNVCEGQRQKHTVSVRWEGDETRPHTFATRDCYPVQDNATKKRIADRLHHLKKVTDLSTPKHQVSYVYDQAMLKHSNVVEPDHVESPERLLRIHERHRDFGLLDRLHLLPPKTATEQQILAVHTQEYFNRLKELATTKLRNLHNQKDEYDSVYFHPDSLESASMAVGCVIQAVDAVVSGECGAGVCVVRPPGHHAAAATPAGFCLLNNATAAATHALRAHGLGRVLLLDWDVHHGNGTQALTFRDPRVLYVSLHRYDRGAFFPSSPDGDHNVVGEGPAEGFNVNIPWNKRGFGDTEYMAAMTQVVLPIATEYRPQLVIVSAGFDACVGDPLGGCKVTPECFARMTQMLRGLAGGRVILCLEGGYNVTSISYAMTLCTKALLGDPIVHHYDPKATCHWSAVESINDVITTHKKYWKSLKFQLALPIENVLEEPAPSRGLMLADTEEIELSKLSLSTTNESPKSSASSQNTSLETDMANLTIDKKKCENGVHCGTDDEAEGSKSDKFKSEARNSGAKSEGNVLNSEPGPSSGNSQRVTSLAEYLADSMQALVNGDMFAIVPLPWCPHLDSLCPIPAELKFEQGTKCVSCDESVENWVCLHCYVTACGRSINGHMQQHFSSSSHTLALSLLDLSVWCNICDAYVDNALLYDAKNNAHRCKFGEDMPWCYRSDPNTVHMI